jgi:hypothetical protein
MEGAMQYIPRSLIDALQLEVTDQRVLSVTDFKTIPTAHGQEIFVHFNIRGT